MQLRHELTRKSIHVALAVLPLAAWLALPANPILVRVGLLLFALLAIGIDFARRRPGRLNAWIRRLVGPLLRDTEDAHLLGATTFAISTAVAFAVFPPTLALVAIGFLVVGDAAAALGGRALGRTRLRPGKTLEGSLACLLGCLAVAAAARGFDLPEARVPILVLGAVVATIAELVASGDTDNLAMPLISGVFMVLAARSC